VEEVDDAALVWLWNTNVRATAVVLDGISRRKDDGTFVSPLVRWLLAARENGRWGTTQEKRVAAVRTGELLQNVRVGDAGHDGVGVRSQGRRLAARSSPAARRRRQEVRLTMADLVKQVSAYGVPDLSACRAPARAGCSTPLGCSTHRRFLLRQS
jgi:hypothetical protein